MNKIVNSKDHLIEEMISGYLKMNAEELKTVDGAKFCLQRKKMEDKVQIIVAGGSGNEPWPMGFVGDGLADGVACGHVYAAPSAKNILDMCKSIPNEKGILILGTNHMGDVLNFNLVCELLSLEGIRAKCLFINDDIASDLENPEERRGIAGIALLVKLAGHFSKKGYSLDQLYEKLLGILPRIRTMGVTTSPGYLPPDGKQMFVLDDGRVSYGMGFNGEPGIEDGKLLSSKEMVQKLLDYLCRDFKATSFKEYYVLLNGFGFTTTLELCIVGNDIYEYFLNSNLNLRHLKLMNALCPQSSGGFSITMVEVEKDILEALTSEGRSPLVYF